jgi:hypothetical protein
LQEALIAELAPTGALEEDIVADIARLVWRKQNLATFGRAELARSYKKFPDATPDLLWRTLSGSERAKVDEVIDGAMTRRGKNSGEKAHEIAIVGRYGNALKGRDRLTADPASGRRDGGKSWLPLPNTGPRYRRGALLRSLIIVHAPSRWARPASWYALENPERIELASV